MIKQSAGILLYRWQDQQLQVLLVHPGGPFWAKKDEGSWTIPKGEPGPDEQLLATAKREFKEETGQAAEGNFLALTPIRQKSGKLVHAWALEGELDVATFKSNTFELEWPPRSGKMKAFPEADRAEWFSKESALAKVLPSQCGFIRELESLLAK